MHTDEDTATERKDASIGMQRTRQKKSTVVVRDSVGNVTGHVSPYRLESIDRFLDCFSPYTYFVYLYPNIAAIYFPLHYAYQNGEK